MMTRTRKRKGVEEDAQRRKEVLAKCEATAVVDRTSSILHRLPPPLLTFVLHFIPLDSKFAQLSHIHRSFPPLVSADFAFDAINLTASLQSAWLSSPRLQQLLSGVRAMMSQSMAVVHRAESSNKLGWQERVRKSDDDSELYHPRSTRRSTQLMPSPHSFTLAQQLSLRVLASRSDRLEIIMAALFDVSKGYAHLHSLHVEVECSNYEQVKPLLQAPSITPLLSLSSLHTLKITDPTTSEDACATHWTAFRHLLSLPITHLDLSRMGVDIPVSAAEFAEGVGDGSSYTGIRRPITSTWKVLKLPQICATVPSRAEVMDVIMRHYAETEIGGTGAGALERLAVQAVKTHDELACVSRLSTLRSLELYAEQPSINLKSLYTTSAAQPSLSSLHSPSISSSSLKHSPLAPLPALRHLLIRNNALDPEGGYLPRGDIQKIIYQ